MQQVLIHGGARAQTTQYETREAAEAFAATAAAQGTDVTLL